MILRWQERPYRDPHKFHRHFLWWPTRVDSGHIVWWETVLRRLVVDDEGGWGGGYRAHWEYEELKP